MKVIDKRGHDFLPFDNYVFRWMSFNLDCTFGIFGACLIFSLYFSYISGL